MLLSRKSDLLVVFLGVISSVDGTLFNCELPKGCRIEQVPILITFYGNEKSSQPINGMRCNIGDNFHFEYKTPVTKNNETCLVDNDYIELRWPSSSDHEIILDKSFDLKNMMLYFSYFKNWLTLTFTNLKGFDLNLISDPKGKSIIENSRLGHYQFVHCSFNFYISGNLVRSCDDIINANLSSITSIFQIKYSSYNGIAKKVYLYESEFKNRLCPLVFKNVYYDFLQITGLIDSFYKRNLVSFFNRTFDNLNSRIVTLYFFKVHNIKFDLDLLNPSVFQQLDNVHVEGFVSSVDGRIFSSLKNFRAIYFKSIYFRKLIHKGIDWIKSINNDLKVEPRSFRQVSNNVKKVRYLFLSPDSDEGVRSDMVSKILPDEDFCIYANFPFDQLVLIYFFTWEQNNFKHFIDDFSCTYMWLIKHLDIYRELNRGYSYLFYQIKQMDMILASEKFKRANTTCHFENRINLCDRSTYEISEIWSSVDSLMLNKKIQIAIRLLSYVVSISGIVANAIVLKVISDKRNSDLFKGFNQYSYLYLNSIFNICILVIELLSWMNECFYPFELFCPEFRKFVVVQFFKIIFRECFVNAFRFLCNFCYFAFALNRISLLGKDHGKIVKFVSEVSVKWYIVVLSVISFGLSTVKYFKYEINYEGVDQTFPISTEMDIVTNLERTQTEFAYADAYFIVNLILDLINYVVFVLVCFFIDLGMVIKLRQVLEDKLKNSAALNQNSKQLDASKKEFDELVNKAIKMVVINTTISILFKLPLAILPIVNLYADYYYKDMLNRIFRPQFDQFYLNLFDTSYYETISYGSDLFYFIAISIQFLIYLRFDKKFKKGFNRIFIDVDKKKQKEIDILRQSSTNQT